MNTKLKVYQACVLSTLLYGSESWSTYARQENRLESFHLAGQGHQRCTVRSSMLYWNRQAPSACTSCCLSADCDGWAMYTAWKMVAFQRMSCMESLLWGAAQWAARRCATRRCATRTSASATSNSQTSTLAAGNRLPRIAAAGVKLCRQETEEERRRETNRRKRKERGGNRDRIPTQRPHTSATTVAKNVMPGLGS